MIDIWNNVLAIFEKHIALISFGVGSVCFLVFGIQFFSGLDSNVYNYAATFSSVFSLASALAAFLFAFYTYAISSDSRFMKAMRATEPFAMMLMYLKTSIKINAALTLFSIPILVLEPLPKEPWLADWWLLLVWTALVYSAAGSFCRAFLLFWIFAARNEHTG